MNHYPSYKDSGVEWIGEIPDDWTTNKIKYLTDGKKDSFIDGDWIESTNISESGIRYITTGNIGEGVYKEQGKGYISEETFEKLDCTEVFSGDLVISRLSPPVGRSCIIPNLQTRIVTSVDNVILRPKKDIDKNFLNFIFNSQGYYSHTDLISRGTTLTRISRTMLGNNKIVLPPIQEQQQISNYLDLKTQQIDSLIEKTQQKIELLKEQRTSLINHMVTKGLNPDVEMKNSGVEWIGEIPVDWEVSKIKYLFDSIGGGTPSTDNNEYWNGDIPWVSPKDMKTQWMKDTQDYITELGLQNSSTNLIEEGTLLIVFRSGILKHSIPISINLVPVTLNQDMKSFHPIDERIITRYLFYFILGNEENLLLDWSKQGVTVESLETDFVNKFHLPIPKREEQQQIVEHLDKGTTKIDSTIGKETQRIKLLKEYRQSLISNVVTGKVDVRDEVIE
jgi:type I restriction enzyme S subunit